MRSSQIERQDAKAAKNAKANRYPGQTTLRIP